MSIYIGIEDLAANALIALMEKDEDCRKVSFRKLVDYGMVVVKILKEKKEDAILIMSKDSTNAMILNYSDFFINEKENPDDEFSEEYIVLKEGKSVADLRNHFRAFLTLNVALAFVDEESLAQLGVCA